MENNYDNTVQEEESRESVEEMQPENLQETQDLFLQEATCASILNPDASKKKKGIRKLFVTQSQKLAELSENILYQFLLQYWNVSIILGKFLEVRETLELLSPMNIMNQTNQYNNIIKAFCQWRGEKKCSGERTVAHFEVWSSEEGYYMIAGKHQQIWTSDFLETLLNAFNQVKKACLSLQSTGTTSMSSMTALTTTRNADAPSCSGLQKCGKRVRLQLPVTSDAEDDSEEVLLQPPLKKRDYMNMFDASVEESLSAGASAKSTHSVSCSTLIKGKEGSLRRTWEESSGLTIVQLNLTKFGNVLGVKDSERWKKAFFRSTIVLQKEHAKIEEMALALA